MLPKRLLSVGGNFTPVRSRRAYLPPPLRTASASISAVHVCPATGKVARDHPQRENACAIAPVTKLRACDLAAIMGNDSGAKPGISRGPPIAWLWDWSARYPTDRALPAINRSGI